MLPIIICATLSRNIELCRFMLERGFDPNDTVSALELLEMTHNISNKSQFSEHYITGNNYNALMCSVIIEELDICNLLVKYNANINAKTDNGFTALIYAAMTNNYDLCDFLIKNNASTKDATKCKYTALNYATLNGNQAICKLLLPEHEKLIELDIYDHPPNSCREYVLKILRQNTHNALSVKNIHELFPKEAQNKYSIQNVSTIMFNLKREKKAISTHNGKTHIWELQ